MQRVALDDLILTDEESAVARRQIRDLAYFRWESAGCPQNRDLEFWTEAELEWVGAFYVPDRFRHQDVAAFS